MTTTITPDTTYPEKFPESETKIINEIRTNAAQAAHEEWLIEMLAAGYEPGFTRNTDPSNGILRNPSLFPFQTLLEAKNKESYKVEDLMTSSQLHFQNLKERIDSNLKFQELDEEMQSKVRSQVDSCIRTVTAMRDLDRTDGFGSWIIMAKGSEGKLPLVDKNIAWSNSAEIIYKGLVQTRGANDVLDGLKEIKSTFKAIDDAEDINDIVKHLSVNASVTQALRNIHNQWKNSWYKIDNLNILTLDDGSTVDLAGMTDSQIDTVMNQNLNDSSALLAYASRLHILEAGMKSKSAEELRDWLENTLNENHSILSSDSTLPSSLTFYTLIDTAKLIQKAIETRGSEPGVVVILRSGLKSRIAEIQKDASVALVQSIIDTIEEKG